MKTAIIRLFVALLSLLASVLELGASLTRLLTALVLRATSAVRPHVEAPIGQPRANRVQTRLRVVPPPARNLDLETGRLVAALVGMGFHVPAVRRFVDSLGDRVGREPIETLIKEGLAKLAA